MVDIVSECIELRDKLFIVIHEKQVKMRSKVLRAVFTAVIKSVLRSAICKDFGIELFDIFKVRFYETFTPKLNIAVTKNTKRILEFGIMKIRDKVRG